VLLPCKGQTSPQVITFNRLWVIYALVRRRLRGLRVKQMDCKFRVLSSTVALRHGKSGTAEVGFRDSDIYWKWTMRKPIE
jgi:hypothetical protein